MKGEKLLALLGSVCLILVLAALPFMAACAPEEVTPEVTYHWKTCHPAALDSIQDLTQSKFAELVKQKTNGQIIIDCYSHEQLGPYRDMFDNVVRGVQEIGLLPISPEFSPILQVVYTVYIADDWEEAMEVYGVDGWMFEYLEPTFEELGIKPLGFLLCGADGFGSTKGPVVMPEDINKLGIKTRVWCPADRLFFQEMGVPTVDMGFAEMYTGMETGVVHAQDNAPVVTYNQLRDVTEYYTDINHIFEPMAFLMNKELFDSLSPELQKAIEESVTEALAWGNKEMEESQEEFYQKMEDYGIKVTRLTTEQRAAWKEYGIRSWAKFEEAVGKEAMDYIRAHVK